MQRELTADNIDKVLSQYLKSIESVGDSINGKKGISLFQAIKRDKTNSGPYSDVSLFEGANRIMTDLVILHGVKWMLNNNEIFPFNKYTVEYGNEDRNENDIESSAGNNRLSGEAFNVARSFFQGKKSAMLRKLRKIENQTNYKVILVNSDAIKSNYSPKRLREGEYFVFIDIVSGKGTLIGHPPLNKIKS